MSDRVPLDLGVLGVVEEVLRDVTDDVWYGETLCQCSVHGITEGWVLGRMCLQVLDGHPTTSEGKSPGDGTEGSGRVVTPLLGPEWCDTGRLYTTDE